MIYILRQGDFIYITQEKRDLNSENNCIDGELLFTLNWSDEDKSVLEECLRPYKDLKSKISRFKFSQDAIEVIKSHPTKISKQYFAYKKDIEEIIQEINECIQCLESFGILENVHITTTLEELQKNVIYKCDVYNLISDDLGEDSYNIISKFQNLKKNERDLVVEFYKKSSKQEKLDYLRNIVMVDIDRVIPFIPKWYRVNLRLFGFDNPSSLDGFRFSNSPEYKDLERLDGNSTVLENPDYFIRKEVYQIFHLNEVWKGKDIKNKFAEIYEKLKTPKSGRVHDIFNYFDTVITRNGYRLVSRKVV